tara:strand:- start:1312 stop:1476 length:165 start_codon:yes stop_codon:yes gene_type:complete
MKKFNTIEKAMEYVETLKGITPKKILTIKLALNENRIARYKGECIIIDLYDLVA